ncbi:MAG: hypothetical protein ACTSPY_05700 [Candidatus Helarchaeota archaeon]
MLEEFDFKDLNEDEILIFLENYLSKMDRRMNISKIEDLITKYFGFDAAS